MTNTTLSELEQAKLHETINKISELFIGDTLPSLDANSNPQDIELQREKLWLDCAIQSGPFESRTYWLTKELRNGEEIVQHSINREEFENDLFSTIKDIRVKMMLSFLIVSRARLTNSNNYAHEATQILNALGYADGLTDSKLADLNLSQLIEKLLLSDLGENKKQ